MPKFNLYQSLHTTVVGPQGKPLEVQIRTREMHQRAEFGVAAHWHYKDGDAGRRPGLAEPHRSTGSSETSRPRPSSWNLKVDLEQDEVFVFTPKGKVITLAGGRHADRLRLRHPHRGRPRLHRGPGQRPAGAARLQAARRATPCEIFTSKVEGAGPSPRLAEDRRHPRAANKIRQWFSRERREDAHRDAAGRSSSRRCAARACRCRRCQPGELASTSAAELNYADLDALLRRRSASTTCRPSRSPRRVRRCCGAATPRRGAAPDHGAPRRGAERAAKQPRRRARRGPRRRDGAAVALLHAGAGRRDHRASSPGAGACRCTGPTAPTPSRWRRPSGDRLIEVEWDNEGGQSYVRGLDRGEGARPVEAPARRVERHLRAPRQHRVLLHDTPAPTASPRCASTSSWATPPTSTRSSARIKPIDSVYDAYRVVPGAKSRV